ncbi:hypothetical protein [Streptomyces sp. NPDC101150]|uniref:hypothetical protein n=1 Tax=Streptomyces sp. NPDC101150 TaxID=3366114 RepID=UPI003816D89B
MLGDTVGSYHHQAVGGFGSAVLTAPPVQRQQRIPRVMNSMDSEQVELITDGPGQAPPHLPLEGS